MKRKNSLLPPSYLFIYLILAVFLHLIFPVKNIITACFFGLVLIVLGLTINLWANNLSKKKKTIVKPDKIPTYLITKGPFSFSRHPMYLGFVLILLGVSLILGSLTSFIAPVLMFITLERKFIPFEEKQMKKCFGKKYLEYQKKVRRWL